MAIERFEDILAWQKALALTKMVYEATRRTDFAKDYGLASQIQRASVSIMANIAEGYERESPTEFYHFLKIARSSCSEVRSHLYVAYHIGYISQAEFDNLTEVAKEVGRLVSGFMRVLDPQRKPKGNRLR